jgi:hypothetical protein
MLAEFQIANIAEASSGSEGTLQSPGASWVEFKWLLALPILIAFLLIALLAKREAKGVRA